jgi:hypothetical protein
MGWKQAHWTGCPFEYVRPALVAKEKTVFSSNSKLRSERPAELE